MQTFPARRTSDRQNGAGAPEVLNALIAHRDAGERARMTVLARRAGFAADEASEKHGALSLLAHAPYDLLLLDGDIEGIDAFDLIATLRAGEKTHNLYAVRIAGPDPERDLAALSAGFDDCLPATASDLEITARLAAARRFGLRQRAFDRAINELYGLASRDELTGVFNRRFFLFEAERMMRKPEPLMLMLFDLDGFKRINDSYGHLTGDRVLRDVGALFQRYTRPDDLLARFGGDEFVMALSGVSAEDAVRIASRLVGEIGKLRWTTGGREVAVGVSVGFASSQSFADPILAQLLDAADRDLYRNKQSGPLIPNGLPIPEAHA